MPMGVMSESCLHFRVVVTVCSCKAKAAVQSYRPVVEEGTNCTPDPQVPLEQCPAALQDFDDGLHVLLLWVVYPPIYLLAYR